MRRQEIEMTVRRRRLLVRSAGLALLALLVGGALVWSRGAARGADPPAGRKPGADRPTPVRTARARLGDVRIVRTGIGNVVPLYSVTVKSRVAGQLVRVLFEEGQLVKAGQVLAEVDARPFAADVVQVEGQRLRDRALLEAAERDLARYRSLAPGTIAPRDVDAQEALVRQYRGSVRAGEGSLHHARLQLAFSRITAPVTGRIGLRQVDPGNLVGPGDPNGLAVINTVQPIAIVFSLPEDDVGEVARRFHAARAAGGRLPVELGDRSGHTRLATGSLASIDNQIDPTTGTFRLKAEAANEDGTLFPNQFVNVSLLLDTRKGAVVVPEPAVQRGALGPFVFVVSPDRTVSRRPIRTGPSDGGVVAIEEGLAADAEVVVNGADKLRDGGKVVVVKPELARGGPPAGTR
jgi:multidrug efflux system membrane fusion protein